MNALPLSEDGKFSYVPSIGKGFQSLDSMVELPLCVVDLWWWFLGRIRSLAGGI